MIYITTIIKVRLYFTLPSLIVKKIAQHCIEPTIYTCIWNDLQFIIKAHFSNTILLYSGWKLLRWYSFWLLRFHSLIKHVIDWKTQLLWKCSKYAPPISISSLLVILYRNDNLRTTLPNLLLTITLHMKIHLASAIKSCCSKLEIGSNAKTLMNSSHLKLEV